MVQKISNYTGNLALSANFEPTSISGLVIGHSGGAVVGDGDIVETSATTITVPDNVAWSVYASFVTGLLVAVATSAVPTSDSLILWQGVSSGGNTTLTDKRSWASTDRIVVDEIGFNEYLTGQFNLNHDWRLQETSGNNAEDDGTDTDIDCSAANPPPIVLAATGDSTYESDLAYTWNGASGATVANTSGVNITLPTGHVGIVFKSGTAFSSRVCFAIGSSSTTEFMFFRPSTLGRWEFSIIGPTNNLTILSTIDNGNLLLDDTYHMCIVNQPGDGTGVDMFIDGVEMLVHNTEVYNGTMDEDSWFQDKPTSGRVALGSATAIGNANWDGEIARIWISDDQCSAAQATLLQEARSGLIAV